MVEERPLGEPRPLGDLGLARSDRSAAGEADGVIHLAFKHDEMRSGDLASALAADLRVIEAVT